MNSEPTGNPTGRIGLRTDGRVQWLTFDQPAKHNALSMAMVEQALDAVRAFCANAEQRVLVLTGGGDRAFVSGADLAEFDREPMRTAPSVDTPPWAPNCSKRWPTARSRRLR